jgi:hypothetical protein
LSYAIVVTTINSPNLVLQELAKGSKRNAGECIIIGDTKTPQGFSLTDAKYFDIEAQHKLDFSYAKNAPVRHYARKNIGYLIAMANKASSIIETDDDNFPQPAFFNTRTEIIDLPILDQKGWINVYRYFSDEHVWPRGLPLDEVKQALGELPMEVQNVLCPIQQGLADGSPDVDAIFRLTSPLEKINFREGKLALGKGVICPFNSQNTTWFPRAYPLMYLPATCSFRMTDIWRSFVAQRVAWEYGWHVAFHGSTVVQERNEHNLMVDFDQEISGYLNNKKIFQALASLKLKGQNPLDDARECYIKMVDSGWLDKKEMTLFDNWGVDLERFYGYY